MFLHRIAGLKHYTILVAALLRLALIVDGLALFGVEHQDYANMVGDQDPSGPGRDGARELVDLFRLVSAMATPVLLACYAWIARRAFEITNCDLKAARS